MKEASLSRGTLHSLRFRLERQSGNKGSVTQQGANTLQLEDNIVFFDYDCLLWRFDPPGLQAHLSGAGIDAYLSKVLLGLTPNNRRRLMLLSCLPSSGFSLGSFAELVEEPLHAIESVLRGAQGWHNLIVIEGKIVRFAHDRLRVGCVDLEMPVVSRLIRGTARCISAHIFGRGW